jgi:hypothetical protein
VDQLLLLSSQWLIVVTTNLDEVMQNINELSGGDFFENVERWEASQKKGRSNWNAYHGIQKTRDRYIAEAREIAGERRLGDPAYFTVTSPDDPAYDPGRSPARATRTLVSLDEAQVQGGAIGHDIHYGHYSYLQLPEPMQNGRHYTITLNNDKKVSFLYDELHTVSRAIKVNQIGYLPDAPRKFAYLGAHLYEFGPLDFSKATRFEVVSVSSGETVLEGEVNLREKNPRFAPRRSNENAGDRPLMYGEDVYEMDLSGLQDEGTFFIRVPGVGRRSRPGVRSLRRRPLRLPL